MRLFGTKPFVAVVFATACLAVSAAARADASSRLTAPQQQRMTALLRQAGQADAAGDPVKAYLSLREATRLEQLWTNNTVGPDSVASGALERYTTALLRREDGSLQKVMHSRQVQLGDKLSLVHMLEQDVIVNYPGVHGDLLQGGYDE
jgi:hypothetical protein